MKNLRILIAAFTISLLSVQTVYAVEVQEVVSPGGIKAWLVEDNSLPVTAIEFAFIGAGSEMDPVGLEGLADMTSSLIDEGAGDIDSRAFQGKLNDLSITLRFSARLDSFGGSFYSLNRYRDEAVDLLRLSLNEPRFDSEPVARIRNQIIVGIKRSENDPDTIASRTLWQNLFPNHHYGRETEGRVDSVTAITSGDMQAFVKSALTRDNLIVGAVGDISPAELGAILDKAFGTLPKGNGRAEPTPIKPVLSGETLVVEMDVPQSVITFAQGGIAREDDDFYAAYVLNHMLGGGGFSSRLTTEIREKRGLAYSVYSHLYAMEDAAIWVGGAATQNARAAETISLVKSEWQRLLDDGVDAQELADAKTYLTGAYPLRFTSSKNIAGMLVSLQRQDLAMDYFDQRNSLIDAITSDDITRVAKRLMKPDQLTIVVVGKPEGIE